MEMAATMNRIPPANILVWRFFTGAHLDGRRRTNATWTKEGTAPRYLCNWWNRKPRLYRLFWRLGTIACVAASVYLFVVGGFLATSCLICGVFVGVYRITRLVTRERKMIRPVNTKLGGRESPHVEREQIDEIGMDEIPEERQNVRNIRNPRRKKGA